MSWFNVEPKGGGVVEMSVELPVTVKQEGDMFVAYSPAVDLSSCGSTEKEAIDMFNEAVRIFFDDLVEQNTVHQVLTDLGWKPQPKQGWVPPKISQQSVDVRVPVLA
jgi:hypothetical protein